MFSCRKKQLKRMKQSNSRERETMCWMILVDYNTYYYEIGEKKLHENDKLSVRIRTMHNAKLCVRCVFWLCAHAVYDNPWYLFSASVLPSSSHLHRCCHRSSVVGRRHTRLKIDFVFFFWFYTFFIVWSFLCCFRFGATTTTTTAASMTEKKPISNLQNAWEVTCEQIVSVS